MYRTLTARGRVGKDMPKHWDALTPAEAERARDTGNIAPGLYNHSTAAAIFAAVGPDLWHRYLKVTVERNPWDRLISLYHWFHNARQDEAMPTDMTAFLDEMAIRYPHHVSNWPLYSLDDTLAVDWVLSYERLTDDIAQLGARLGSHLTLPEKKLKAGLREDTRSYREVLTDSAATRIGQLCRKEIAAFAYRF